MSDHGLLTPRQNEIYEFICQRIDDRGFPPTIRDIGTALDKKGFITREGKSARAIRPTSRALPKSGLPFKGLVAAGSPIAAEAQDERLDLHDMFASPDTYVLQVRGQSMIENHIEDGDYV